jgi:hypothetical protein
MAKKGMTYEEEMAAFSRYADAMHAARPRNQAAAWKDNPNRDADLHRHAQRIQRSGNKLEAARAAWERIMAGETPTPAAAGRLWTHPAG